jgi:hypothetical protein
VAAYQREAAVGGVDKWHGVCFICARVRAMQSRAERVSARHDRAVACVRAWQWGGSGTEATAAAMTQCEAAHFGARQLSVPRWRGGCAKAPCGKKGA